MERNLRRMFKNNAGFGEESSRIAKTRRLTLHKRKEDRNREFLQRRNVTIEATPPEPVVKDPRREKLLKWKAKKEALLESAKAKKKPPFRVGVLQHKLCPLQDLSNLPAPKSTVKKTTSRKAVYEPTEHILKETAASKALAALANLGDLGARRVTRSQAQMATQQLQGPAKGQSAAKKKNNESFAPKNHIFKAPINLTFPVTPDTLKRNPRRGQTTLKKSALSNWPTISGVSLLKDVELPPGDSGEKKGDPTNPAKVQLPAPTRKNGKTVTHPVGVKLPAPTRKNVKVVPDPVEVQLKTEADPVGVELPAGTSKNVKVVPDPVEVQLKTEADPVGVELPAGTSKNVKVVPDPIEVQLPDVKKEVKSPQKRRSVRIATPHRRNDENPSEDTENPVVLAKVSRLSIHSPTRMEVYIPPPEERGDKLPAQFSPFIVTARGADRHKHWRRSRAEMVKAVLTEEEKKAEQVKNFRSLLESETIRLLALCEKWEDIQTSSPGALPSTAEDLILGAVGQTRLLTKDKFKQFERLVDAFEDGLTTEGKMTADDLTGFWEMIHVTVTGLDNRFKNLGELQKNNWIVEEAKVAPKRPPKPRNVKPEIIQASKSRIREAIAAAKRKQQMKLQTSKDETVKSFDGGFFKIESPKRPAASEPGLSVSSPATPDRRPRKSLLQQVLTHSANRVKSPSISEVSTRIRASLLGRRVSMSRPEDEQTLRPIPASTATPGKGILKTTSAAIQKNKVVFLPKDSEEVPEHKENASEATKEESTHKSLRRSLRFSVCTKFAGSPGTPAPNPKPSLMPMRESNGLPPKPLENGELISWATP